MKATAQIGHTSSNISDAVLHGERREAKDLENDPIIKWRALIYKSWASARSSNPFYWNWQIKHTFVADGKRTFKSMPSLSSNQQVPCCDFNPAAMYAHQYDAWIGFNSWARFAAPGLVYGGSWYFKCIHSGNQWQILNYRTSDRQHW